jgi:hypothetical protein
MKINRKLFALWFGALVCGTRCLECFFNANCELVKSQIITSCRPGVPLNAFQRGLVREYGQGSMYIENVFVYFETEKAQFCLPTDHKDEVEVTVVSVPENPPIKCNVYKKIPNRTAELKPDEVSNILKSMLNALQTPQGNIYLSFFDHFLPKKAVITQYEEEIINLDGVQPRSLLHISSKDATNSVLEYVDFDNCEKKPDHPRLKSLYRELMHKQMPIYPIRSVIELDIETLLKCMELLQTHIEKTPGLDNDCIKKALDDYKERIKSKFPGLSDEDIAKQNNHIELLDCLPSYEELKSLFEQISTEVSEDDTAIDPLLVSIRKALECNTQNNIHLFACATSMMLKCMRDFYDAEIWEEVN